MILGLVYAVRSKWLMKKQGLAVLTAKEIMLEK